MVALCSRRGALASTLPWAGDANESSTGQVRGPGLRRAGRCPSPREARTRERVGSRPLRSPPTRRTDTAASFRRAVLGLAPMPRGGTAKKGWPPFPPFADRPRVRQPRPIRPARRLAGRRVPPRPLDPGQFASANGAPSYQPRASPPGASPWAARPKLPLPGGEGWGGGGPLSAKPQIKTQAKARRLPRLIPRLHPLPCKSISACHSRS